MDSRDGSESDGGGGGGGLQATSPPAAHPWGANHGDNLQIEVLGSQKGARA